MDGLVQPHWLGGVRADGLTLDASEPFVMAGVEWVAPVDARIELRARLVGGRWTPWVTASVQGHDADGGVAPAHACFGEPVWTGNATALQLRADHGLEGVSVHLISARIRKQVEAPRARSTGMSPQAIPAATNGGYPLARPILPAGPGQPPIIARSAWAGNRGPASMPGYGDVRLMFVHHSVNANGYSAAEVPEMLLSIYQYHRYVKGWSDIGYNFAVDAYGRVWEARAGGIDQAVVGAQAGGYNLESAGAVMLGTFTATLPTAAALSALQDLLAWKLCLHGVPVSGNVTVEVDPADAFYTRYRGGQQVVLTRISGHRQGCTTDCPGDDLFNHLPVLRSNVAALVGASQVTLTLDFAPGQDSAAAQFLDLASVSVVAGATVSLEGRLSQQTISGTLGAPVSDATLEIQSLVGEREAVLAGSDGPLGTLTTDADGAFTAAFTPQHNLLVRALRTQSPAVASPLLSVGVAPAVTLTVDSESPLRLTGTVTPHKAKVALDAYQGGARTPKHQQTVDVAADGTFEVVPKLKSGAYHLVAATAADALNLAGKSAPLAVTV